MLLEQDMCYGICGTRPPHTGFGLLGPLLDPDSEWTAAWGGGVESSLVRSRRDHKEIEESVTSWPPLALGTDRYP